MENLYIYIENENVDFILKYGMKLSEYVNKILLVKDQEKKGITAYLSPKDSIMYSNENYTCLRIFHEGLKILIYNKMCEKNDILRDFVCDFDKYKLGTYEDPIALIYSSILPENIFIYNKLRDYPLLIETSKDYYYEKFINEMLDNSYFSNYELYQLLLILGEQKKIFATYKIEDNIKVLKDKKNGKKYIKKSSF